ncbi:hypothetical protein CT0427 [Chlorobaculum tepidum TLS]|uniref:Uncharacterized protein n=1 Tax=Chlorobaculum tepidum (strain ATCC 49652 / DSM 12025 / NBRC 103806 / TLS) TaxID=194439 RepID=Q8KFA0_CHLTE|nr:hypothetical protein CT0427 [Chlorobaculum tepidum TLS]
MFPPFVLLKSLVNQLIEIVSLFPANLIAVSATQKKDYTRLLAGQHEPVLQAKPRDNSWTLITKS